MMTLNNLKPKNSKKIFRFLIISIIINLTMLPIITINKCSSNNRNFEEQNSLAIAPTYTTKNKTTNRNASVQSLLINNHSDKTMSDIITADPYLELYKYKSRKYKSSELKKIMDDSPLMDVYFILEFHAPLSYDQLSTINKMRVVSKLKVKSEYLGKMWGIYYSRYESIKKIASFPFIKNIYLMKRFTSKGYYNIALKTMVPSENFNLSLMLPHSKPGKELIYMKPNIRGIFKVNAQNITGNQLNMNIRTKGRPIVLFCEISYVVDLLITLKMSVYNEDEMNMHQYSKLMNSPEYIDTYRLFTSESTKIFTTPLVEQFASQIPSQESISMHYIALWRLIQDRIPYDKQKKDIFFSGRTNYFDIRDMYRNMQELELDGIGACTERRPLEVAVLRKLGIAARVATRVSHVFAEIYIPNKGWVSTSPLLNEVPLCESPNQEINYFIDWQPKIPVRILTWKSILYPVINKF